MIQMAIVAMLHAVQPACAQTDAKPVPATGSAVTWFARGGPEQQGHAQATAGAKPAIRWTTKTGAPIKSSAALDAQRVYVGSDDGILYALNRKTGAVEWRFETQAPIEASPILAGGMVVFGSTDDHLYAVQSKTGALVWKHLTPDKMVAAVTPVTIAGEAALIAGGYDGLVQARRLSDGIPIWDYKTDSYIYGSAAVSEGRVIFGGCDGAIHVLNAEKGTMIRRIEVGPYVGAAVAVQNNHAYFGHFGNRVAAVDLNAGTFVWHSTDTGFPFLSSAAMGSTALFIGGRDRTLHAFSPTDGQSLWTFRALGRVDSSPITFDGSVLFGSSDGRLYQLAQTDGSMQWSLDLGAPITATPAAHGRTIFVGTHDGSVYALEARNTP